MSIWRAAPLGKDETTRSIHFAFPSCSAMMAFAADRGAQKRAHAGQCAGAGAAI